MTHPNLCTAKQSQLLAKRGIPLSHALEMTFATAQAAIEELAAMQWKTTPTWLEKWGGPNVFKLRPDLAPGYKPAPPMLVVDRTDHEIVAQTNKLAREFYRMAFGHTVGPEHLFHESDRVDYHPQERMCWDMACAAQQELTSTDPNDALANLD